MGCGVILDLEYWASHIFLRGSQPTVQTAQAPLVEDAAQNDRIP